MNAAFNIAALVYPVTDMACCLLLIVFMFYLRDRITVVTRLVEGSNITAADYSVLVRGLPTDADQESVLAHFDGLYNLEKPDWTFKGHCCWLGRKMRRRHTEHAAPLSSTKARASPRSSIHVRRCMPRTLMYLAVIHTVHTTGVPSVHGCTTGDCQPPCHCARTDG